MSDALRGGVRDAFPEGLVPMIMRSTGKPRVAAPV